MKVIVDTSVWALALRRQAPVKSVHRTLLAELVRDGRVVMLGVIRQELLSGIRIADQYAKVRVHLRAFPDLVVKTEDHELAAEFFNACMAKGIQGNPTDFLICAAADRNRQAILTTDKDFVRYQRHVPVNLVPCSEGAGSGG
ncbi:MAG TPA: PIN domain-containing protein [Chthoniobacterales bacterium]